MLSSFISYIPKGPKRKTKTLATGRQDAVASRTFADAGEYGSYGIASSKPTPSWDYNTSFAHHRPPQVLDIRDGNQSSSRDGRRRPSEEEFLQEPPPASPRLEINLPQSNLADLMPPDLAKRKSFTLFMDAAVEDARDDGQRPWVAELGGNEGALRRGNSTETHEQQTEESIAMVSSDDHGVGLRQVNGDGRGNDEDDEGSVYSLEYVNFDAADAASNSPQQKSTEVDEETLLPYASTSRKPAPAPIQIPNFSLYGPKVQLLHTAGNQSRPQSRGNESIASTEPSSAVSGTSLARALFANTFVLSGNQTSRYRSGVSATFARQDSATLPRGEHPLMSSPFFGDRGDQFGSPIMIPGGTGVTLPPPSSYRPSTADSMHRRMPKRSGPDLRDRPKTAPGKRMSAKSLPNRATQDVDHVTTALELPTLPDEITAERRSSSASPDRASRRISRISEATSSAPNTPDPVTQPQPKETEQTSEQSNLTDSTASSNKSEPEPSIETSPSNHPRVELTTAKSDSDIASPPPQSLVEASPEIMPQEEQEAHDHRPIEAQPAQNPQQLSTVAASPAPTPRSAGGFSMTSEPGSGKEIDNVLDYYQFDSQQSTFPTLRLPFSPISEESSSMLSPVSSQKSSGAVSGGSLGGESKMSKQQTEARLSLVPNAVRAAAEWSPRKPQSPPLMPIGGRELPRRPALLPIGERPRSTQVGASHPMSINSPLSSSSSRLGTATFSVSTASTLTSLASPDNGEPLLPPSRTIFNRARSGSAPSPIKVIRTSRDLRRLPVAVLTPLTGDSMKQEDSGPPQLTAEPAKDMEDGAKENPHVEATIQEDDRSPSSSTRSLQRSDSQEFPETPSAFSPTWTFNMLSPVNRGESTHEYPVLMPLSAGVPARGSITPASLTQQVLLTRAATSVRGARHSRQASLLRNATAPAKVESSKDDSNAIPGSSKEPDASQASQISPAKRPLSEMEEEAESIGSPILPGTHRMVVEEPNEMDFQLHDQVSPSISIRQNSLPEDVTSDDILFSPRIPSSPARSPRPRVGDPVLPTIYDLPPNATQRSASSSSVPSTPALSIRSAPSPNLSAPQPHRDHSRPSSPRILAGPSLQPHSPNLSSPRIPASPHVYDSSAHSHSSPHLSPIPSHTKAPDVTSLSSASIRSVSPSSRSFTSHSSPHLPPISPARNPDQPFYAHPNRNVGTPPYDSPRSVSATRPPPLSLDTPSSGRSPALPIINTPSTSLPSSLNLVSPFTSLPGDLDIDHPLSPSFVAPPPYSTIAHIHPPQDSPFTHVAHGSEYPYGTTHTPSSAHPNAHLEIDPRTPLSAVPRRPRARPPLPIGPRRPQQGTTHLTTATLEPRHRNASAPNLPSSVPPVGGRHQRQYSAQVPKFRPPAPKWRGYTLEAAKWTFSSAELQAIVSRAIRQSAEASSFRLLQLETLDCDIAQEIEKLHTQRADIKTKYKLMTRRRAGLFDTLSAHLEGAVLEFSVPPLRVLDELSEISTTLDELAEELDSVDEQLNQLTSLCEVHSSSALAMALRKLNTSFLKQVSENQSLKAQIETLEAEKDDAWKQAQDVANEYDELTKKLDSIPPDSAGHRSSRVMASRKSSIRASKAGLRSTSSFRRSQRSSVSSNGQRMSTASLASATLSPNEVPPVPPIPRHRPFEIVTDIPTRASSGVYTPTSETRAMVRAQQELCDMLGITLKDPPAPLKRSHSVSDRPLEVADFSSLRPNTETSPRHSDTGSAGRRSSMPSSHGLYHVHNAMTLDRKAMLTTLGMLSD